MPYLQLRLVSKNDKGRDSYRHFTQQGGSIGRSNDCDWTLLDTDRYISNKHALISFSHQQFIITDVSSNGLLINNSRSPLGKNNQYVLKLSDSITIGKYCIQVESIEVGENPVSANSGNHDLLNLVMGGDDKVAAVDECSPLSTKPKNLDFQASNSSEDGLGLNEILSGAVNPQTSYGRSTTTLENNLTDKNLEVSSAFNKPQEYKSQELTENNQHYLANDKSIPEDWELSGVMPAIVDYKSPNESALSKGSNVVPKEQNKETINKEVSKSSELLNPANFQTEDQENEVLAVGNLQNQKPIIGEVDMSTQSITEDVIANLDNVTFEPEDIYNESVKDESVKDESAEKLTETSNENSSVESSSNITDVSSSKLESTPLQSNQESFFINLYHKLGLPKEYISSVDTDIFADDIVTILMSTTKGLMTLLNSRTAFKQESRLSLTSVQPRSNNPIKFSIDPVDTLEMLILKKKKGYMSTKEAYEEAVYDIQLHQMAFLTGLQATLEGVLGQLEPDIIEKQVDEKGRSFMGRNSNAHYWKLYKEKQLLLTKSVKENLNEVLSNHFSDAYQAQINKFKNE